MTSKLTALIEAAKAVTQHPSAPDVRREYHAWANPATILELCALLEKAEGALNLWKCARDNSEESELDDMACQCVPMPLFCDSEESMDDALAAIKQWKEKSDAIRGLA